MKISIKINIQNQWSPGSIYTGIIKNTYDPLLGHIFNPFRLNGRLLIMNPRHLGTWTTRYLDISVLTWTSRYWTFRYWPGHLGTRYWTVRDLENSQFWHDIQIMTGAFLNIMKYWCRQIGKNQPLQTTTMLR
jgi:hypothetical protein